MDHLLFVLVHAQNNDDATSVGISDRRRNDVAQENRLSQDMHIRELSSK